ncbi:MAG: phage integrase SAM-like domain-containing protein [Pseudosphingobacterium sp.]|nr:phage integrase SAM-like domain-containing protein [Pseudosphingobacterium sp.]
MATVDAKVLAHHGKNDGTWNVKISVYHKGQTKYIETEHFVTARQLTKNLEIKDTFLISIINKQLDNYRKEISKLGSALELFTAQTLKDYLIQNGEEIDFLKFSKEHIEQLRKERRKKFEQGKVKNKNCKNATSLNTVRNSLIDFFGKQSVSVKAINTSMLDEYDSYLRSERTMTRLDQFQREVTTTQKALGDASVHNYMKDLRTLFNACVKKYNIPRLNIKRIHHNPFEDYQIVAAPTTKKRNIPVEMIRELRDSSVKKGSSAELARDLFMLSFYMCGINAVDLYYARPENMVKGRLEYNRSKTEDKREDNAFISIKIVPEAKPLLKKYIGKLSERYSSNERLNHALSDGMEHLCKLLGWDKPVTFYWARHSFGTIARNKCGVHKDDVGEALNHVYEGHKSTDIYIEKDWSVIDMVQAKVIGYLKGTVQPRPEKKINLKNLLAEMTYEDLMSIVAEKFVQAKSA